MNADRPGGLYPTPTRVGLLREVAAGNVFQDVIGDSYISGGAKVNARIDELAKAKWVRLADADESGTRLPTWQPADLGTTLLEERTRFTVTFDRIGRSHVVDPLTVEARDADDLSGKVLEYARPHLVSRDVEIWVDLQKLRGGILCGFNNGGTFTIAQVPA